MKKNPMLDGRKPVYICYDPGLHKTWKVAMSSIAIFAFAVGMLAQRVWGLIP